MIENVRIEGLLKQLAIGRVALGATSFLLPGLTVKAMGLGRGHDGGRDYVTRAFAAREIALGMGYLMSSGSSRSAWARLGLVVDSLDTVSALKSRRAVPLWATAGGILVSGGAAALAALAGELGGG